MKTYPAIAFTISLVTSAWAQDGKPVQVGFDEAIKLFPQKTTVEGFVNACHEFSRTPSVTNEQAIEWMLARSNQIAAYLEANPKPAEKPVMTVGKGAHSVSGGPQSHTGAASRQKYKDEVEKNRQLAQKHHEYDTLALLLDEYIQKLQIVLGTQSLRPAVVKAARENKIHRVVAARLGLGPGK